MLRWTCGLVLTAAAFAQNYSTMVPHGTYEEISLNEIRYSPDAAVKLLLLEGFPARHPDSPLLPWVYDQARTIYESRDDSAKVAAMSEAIVRRLPSDLYSVYVLFRFATQQSDAPALARWTARLTELVPAALSRPKPAGEADAEIWREQKSLAAQIAPHLDYQAYLQLTRASDARTRLALIEAFLRDRPASTYTSQAQSLYLLTCQQLGDNERALELARRTLDREPDHPEMLAMLLDAAYQKQDSAATLTYAKRLIDVLDRNIHPNGVGAPEWSKRKSQLQGSALWMIGATEMLTQSYASADAALRAALPLLREHRSPLVSASLYYLGWANYRLGRAFDAAKFNRECAAMVTVYQARCVRNLQVLVSETAGVR